MRYAIIADIHANLAAFVAVLDDILRQGGADELWCLGDVVGYGPDPHDCIELVCRYQHLCVAGNHDWAAIGRMDTAEFNPAAAAACLWTANQLTIEDREYLAGRPLSIRRGVCTLVHGSPREPVREYLVTTGQAEANAANFQTPVCLVGHSHVPLLFEYEKSGKCFRYPLPEGEAVVLKGRRLIINPGSVGQPRDGDPRAGYALYDDGAGTVIERRVPYDVALTQGRMREHNLPERLIVRLDRGQ